MQSLFTKILSGFGIVALIFGIGFGSGYKVKSNAINAYNAQQEVKLASLQARYDNVSATAQSDYLTMFNEVTKQYESSNITSTINKHDKLWNFWFKRSTSKMSKTESSIGVDESTTQSLENCKLNTIQLQYLQQYIKQTEGLQNE